MRVSRENPAGVIKLLLLTGSGATGEPVLHQLHRQETAGEEMAREERREEEGMSREERRGVERRGGEEEEERRGEEDKMESDGN